MILSGPPCPRCGARTELREDGPSRFRNGRYEQRYRIVCPICSRPRAPKCGVCLVELTGQPWAHVGWRLVCVECGEALGGVNAAFMAAYQFAPKAVA